jgi:hypothetical protein
MANKYWVGGTGTWSTAGRWSTSTGTASFVGSRSGTNLTVSTLQSGSLAVGQLLYNASGTAAGSITGGSGSSWTTSSTGTIASGNLYTMAAGSNTTVPASTGVDEVIFDGNSGLNFTVTLGSSSYAANLYIGVAGTVPSGAISTVLKGTMTLVGTSTLYLYGNLNLPQTGFTWSHTGLLNLASTGTMNFTSRGNIINSPVTMTSAGPSIKLVDSFTTTGICTFTAGALDFTNGDVSTGVYFTCASLTTSNTYVKTVTTGSTGKLCLSGSSGILLSWGTNATSSINFNTSTTTSVSPGYLPILLTSSSLGTVTINSYYARSQIEISGSSGAVTVNCDYGYNYPRLIAPNFTGSINFLNSGTTNTASTQSFGTMNAPNCGVIMGTFTSYPLWNFVNAYIKFNPSVSFITATQTSISFSNCTIDQSNGSIIYPSSAAYLYIIGGTVINGNFVFSKLLQFTPTIVTNYCTLTADTTYASPGATTFGSTSNLNILPDLIVKGDGKLKLTYNPGCCVGDVLAYVKSIDLTNYTGTFDSSTLYMSSNLEIPVNITAEKAALLSIVFVNLSPITLKTNNILVSNIKLYGNTVNLLSDTTINGFTLDAGGLSTNNYTFKVLNTFNSFVIGSSSTKTLNFGTSNVYLPTLIFGNNYVPNSLTILDSNYTIYINGSSFYLDNLSWNNIVIDAANSTFAPATSNNFVLSSRGATVKSLTSTVPTASRSVSIQGTINCGNFNLNGGAAYPLKVIGGTGTFAVNIVGVGSASAVFTLNNTGTNPSVSNYINLSYGNATPSNMNYAVNSTNGGNNTGWTFGVVPITTISYSSNFFAFF